MPTVAPLDPADIPAVRELLVTGLTQRWGRYDASRNPDIESFPAAYQDGLVLVAKEADQVVGTGTLRPLDALTAEVVRMSVAPAWRRRGIGGAVLACLLAHARERGVRQVVLETTSTWESAVAFYGRHGFRQTHVSGGDTYFALSLATD